VRRMLRLWHVIGIRVLGGGVRRGGLASGHQPGHVGVVQDQLTPRTVASKIGTVQTNIKKIIK
jgi:hypothetical protein